MPKILFVPLQVVIVALLFVLLHGTTVAGANTEASLEESITKLEQLLDTLEMKREDRDVVRVEFERLRGNLSAIGPNLSSIKRITDELKKVLSDALVNPGVKQKVNDKFREIESILQEMEKELESSAEDRVNIELGVQEAITLKDSRFSVTAITEILAKKPEFKFGTADLNSDQMKRLREKFDEDFIKNWVGVPQFVTVGASAIYLTDANKTVGALVLRILTPPRSYFSQLKLWPWSPIRNKSFFQSVWHNLDPDNPDAWFNRFDLNVGVTSTSGTDQVEAGNFILAGFSYQLHRAAF